jgi:hypothetical protein
MSIDELIRRLRDLAEVTDRMAEFGFPPKRALKRRGFTVETANHFGVRWDEGDGSWIRVRLPQRCTLG